MTNRLIAKLRNTWREFVRAKDGNTVVIFAVAIIPMVGLTGAAVSLAYAGLPTGRWLTSLGGVLLLSVAVVIGSDNAFLFFLAWEALTVCVYLISTVGHDREDLLATLGIPRGPDA